MFKYKFTSVDFVALITLLAFFSFKLTTLSVRFGDGNVYIYAAHLLTNGLLPYRDFFVVVPPMILYFIAAFSLIFQQQLILYSLIPVFCEILTAIFIYLTLKSSNNKLAILGPALYLFSFTILATSDYLTGVAIVNLFSSLAIFLVIKKKFIAAGVIFALALTTKFYTLPIVFGVGVYLIISKQYQKALILSTSFLLTSVFIVLPYLLFAREDFIKDLIVHQLHRPPGLAKTDVASFFIGKELIILSLAVGAFFVRKFSLLLYALPAVFLSLFFVFFSDIYYLYLASLMPFLILLATETINWIWQSFKIYRTVILILASIGFLVIIYQDSEYLNTTSLLGKFENSEQVGNFISGLPENYPLYGNHNIAPAMAMTAGRGLFQNIVDTNPQTFRSGANNISEISQQASLNGVYLIARTIKDSDTKVGYEDIFDQDIFEKYCTKLKDFPSIEIETFNQISIYKCKRE